MRAAEADTRHGFDCSRGLPACQIPAARPQAIVQMDSNDVGSQFLNTVVLPQWLDRCGAPCEAIITQGLIPALSNPPAGILSAAGTSGGMSD